MELLEEEIKQVGWGPLVVRTIGADYLNDNAVKLLNQIGRKVPWNQGLSSVLNQLEPLAKDASTQGESVRVMTMSQSKGITVNTCIVMGVEEGIMPHPKGDTEEERRLLYVAMTRATDMTILTFAGRRHGPTARQEERT